MTHLISAPPVGSQWTERPPYDKVIREVKSHDAEPDAQGRARVKLGYRDSDARQTSARVDRFVGGYVPVNQAAIEYVAQAKAEKKALKG